MNAWDRSPKETDPAWIAFVAYRDQGPGRTVPKAWAACGRPAGSLRLAETWSTRHDWVARARAWDAHVDQKSVQPAVARAAADMAVRHQQLGRAFQGVAATALPTLRKRAEAGKLKAGEVAALAKVGVDVERVASGEATERSEVVGDPLRPIPVRVLRFDVGAFPAPGAQA